MAILKQQKLLELITENSGKPIDEQKSIRQLILDAGYSQDEADNPKRILQTQSWNELVDSLLPDQDILTKLRENALQNKSYLASNQAIDTIIKIKGKYAPTRIQMNIDEELSDEELEQRIAEKKRQIAEQEQNSSKQDENESKHDENNSEQNENTTENIDGGDYPADDPNTTAL